MKKVMSFISVWLLIGILLCGCGGAGTGDSTDETVLSESISASESASSSETEIKDDSALPQISAVLGEPTYVREVCGNGTTVASDVKEEVDRYNRFNSPALTVPEKFSDSVQHVYTSVKKDKYDAYINELLSRGCEILAQNSIGTVYFTTLKAPAERLLTAYFISTEKLIRVIDEPYHEVDTVLPSPENAPSDCPTSIITLPLTANHEQSCFVITLSDGRLVLFDTGYTNVLDAGEGLINTLKEYSYYYNNTPEKKVRIAAIYISHLHDDHYGGLLALAKKYSDIVEVERVYANFPSTQKENYWDDPLYVEEQSKNIISAANKLGAEFKFVRSGQKVRIADADFEILYTPDDLGKYEIRKDQDGSKDTSRDINNTCLYMRMTVKGKTAIFCGDSRQGQTARVCKMYITGLKCDILSVAHHGYNANDSKQLYTTYGKPSVLLWTNTRQILAANTSHRNFIDSLQKLSCVTEHVYPEANKRAVYEIK